MHKPSPKQAQLADLLHALQSPPTCSWRHPSQRLLIPAAGDTSSPNLISSGQPSALSNLHRLTYRARTLAPGSGLSLITAVSFYLVSSKAAPIGTGSLSLCLSSPVTPDDPRLVSDITKHG